jgi:myosin protein heavy chain
MNAQLNDDVNRARDKIERLLRNIEELQHNDSDAQLLARRAERELREEREKALRLERELDGWKATRAERGSTIGRNVTFGEDGNRRGSGVYGSSDVPQRQPSNTKGFL